MAPPVDNSAGEHVLRVCPAARRPVLAVGPELKSTLCRLTGDRAEISPALGHLGDAEAYRAFVATAEVWRKGPPAAELLAHDLHPDYAATRWARDAGLPTEPVQHHHAHIVACMAENNLSGPVLGIAADGTGYGTDGTIWGCEILRCEPATFRRLGCLRPFPLLGGDRAAIETLRPALGVLHETFGTSLPPRAEALLAEEDAETVAYLRNRLCAPARRNTTREAFVRTTSLGRLFDAVAFLLGLCRKNTTEAEAAISVQTAGELAISAGDLVEPAGSLPSSAGISADGSADENLLQIDYRPMVTEILQAEPQNTPAMALRFHLALADALTRATKTLAEREAIQQVCLSGGCFFNPILRSALRKRLLGVGLEVYEHKTLMPGDGCVSLGQAVCAAARML
jgi:hydrogenase maturation protein HypF